MLVKTRAIGLAALTLMIGGANAGVLTTMASSTTTIGWGANTTITNYYPQASGNVVLNTANNQNPGNACASSQYLEIDSTDPNFNQLFATIVVAQATGQTVSLYYNGCYQGGYPDITAIAVGGIW